MAMEKARFRVKEFVARLGITQKELAEKVGVKPETVYKWANGTNTPTYDVIVLLKRLGCTDYELYSETFSEQEEFFKKRLLNAHNHFLEEMGIKTVLTKEKI
jgi:transcriptional regulator with XRE-family HTH domain